MIERRAQPTRAARSVWLRGACVLALLLGMSTRAEAQTLTSGLLRGRVTDESGEALRDVRVVVEDVLSGLAHETRTDLNGRFTIRLLPSATYNVLAERLGYRPHVLSGVTVRPGRWTDVPIIVTRVEPPVDRSDTTRFAGTGAGWSRGGASRWFGPLEIDAPHDRLVESALLELISPPASRPAAEGLPLRLTARAAEGIGAGTFTGSAFGVEGAAFPIVGLDYAELVSGVTDVEVGGATGPTLFTYGRRGTRSFASRVWGAGADPELPTGSFSDDFVTAYDQLRAGAEIGGPIIRDTAVYVAGGEWRRVTRALPRAFRRDDPSAARLAALARANGNAPLAGLALPLVEERDEVAGWGRFDWRVADGHDLGVFLEIARSAAPTGSDPLQELPSRLGTGDALDVGGGASVKSRLTNRFSNEVRLGVARSTRSETLSGEDDVRAFTGFPTTFALPSDVVFGVSPFAPSTSEHTAVKLEQALLVGFGRHLFKAGLIVNWDSRSQSGAWGRAGSFVFGGSDSSGVEGGSFTQLVGAAPSASWSTLEVGLMLQDTWEPTPGLEIIGGVRLLDEDLPDFDPAMNAWRAAAGLDGGNVDEVRQIAPRVGFRWNIRQEDRWIVRANLGRYDGDIDPAVIGERMAFDGRQQMRRAFGSLEYWPSVPDSNVAPLAGPVLAFLGPDFEAPTTTRANFGVSLVGRTSVHLSASYRHTDYLPARRDLNLATGPSARDQYGRAIFGDLVQHGALIGASPGTNRRFRDFDVVSAIEATAHSEYWETALQLERRVGERIRFAGWYVFSQTRDNWLDADPGSLLIAPQLGDSAGSSGWADGISDFDVPHRVGIVAEIALPLPLRPVIGAVYRAQSGVPFTPGYARGVDANGDYFANDPAFVDPLVPGMQDVLDEWDCVSEQSDQFAERNSCRTDALHFLDARLGLELRTNVGSARVFVDGMNLLRTEYPDPDAALVLVDPERTLVRDDATGIVSVPLVANSDFGQSRRTIRSPRILRIGAEVNF